MKKCLPPASPAQREAMRVLLEGQQWRFAKTMPQNPHEYTLRNTWSVDAQFQQAVRFIRQHGYVERFKGRPYVVLDLGGWHYWTMGAPLADTRLINRKPWPSGDAQ
jgi:hypothetical protein